MKRRKRILFRLRALWAGWTMQPIAGGDDGGEPAGDPPAAADPPASDPPSGDSPAGKSDPPWKSDEDFNPEKAWKLIEGLRGDKDKLKTERDEFATKVRTFEDASKSEQEKLAEQAAADKKAATEATREAARLRVALKKGLSETQAKRLVGDSEEALEKDADELLESFKQEDEGKAPRAPRERLRSGAAPSAEPDETDPRKLAGKVSRL